MIMEYKVVIQENLCNGHTYIHTFPLEPEYMDEAVTFRTMSFHADCIFIVEYSLN